MKAAPSLRGGRPWTYCKTCKRVAIQVPYYVDLPYWVDRPGATPPSFDPNDATYQATLDPLPEYLSRR